MRARIASAGMAMRGFGAAISVCGSLFACSAARAIELDGAWANEETVCPKVFVRKGNDISVSKSADAFGSGFVIKGNRIRGNIVTCTIRTRKQDSAVLHLHTVCSTDVALQDVQFSLRPESEDKITRLFPGMPELDRAYYRCSFKAAQ